MLTVVDTKTGEKMTDELIVENVGSFFVTPWRFSDLDPSCSRSSSVVMKGTQVRSFVYVSGFMLTPYD